MGEFLGKEDKKAGQCVFLFGHFSFFFGGGEFGANDLQSYFFLEMEETLYFV